MDPLVFLLLSLFVLGIIAQAMADTATLEVPPQQQKVVSFTLNSGDSASGTLVTNGVATVDFWITDPQNRNVTVYGNTGNIQFSFEAQTSGTFLFHVFNKNSDTVLGTLNYTLVHRIFGMPQETFLLLVIVGVVLLMLIIWALMSKA
ncbi:MAG TPA: emp24/gp25L/p24 family protein [Candidatus Krumholzibacteriaceae bacterium]|nr:emp24/gp25L/p24 family protein [Candidatus Krumholzibacteriaceae bacterium]